MQDLSLFESNSQPITINNHLSFNFNNHINSNLTKLSSLTETKSYTPITGCVLEHILTTTNLTNWEKLYYLLADSLSLISKNRGASRFCALPSEDWAEYLGCSRSLVFTMQQSLVKKGYFIINKDFDKIGRNKRNLITPSLPTSVFNHLNEKYPDRVGDHTSYNCFVECKRSYLDRTKLFIKLNYNLLKIISSNKYTNPRQKVMWLDFYTRCYKNYMLQDREDFNLGKYSYNDDSIFSFITSYRELADIYSCNTKYLSKFIRALEELGFIKTQNIYIRKKYGDNDDCMVQERQDRSLWKITLSLPESCISELEKVKDRSNLKLKDIKVEVFTIKNTFDSKLIEDCLILEGIKFNLNLEQSSLLKSIIVDDNDEDCSTIVNCNGNIDTIPSLLRSPYDESYIDSVMEELDIDNTWKVENKLEESSKIDDCKFLSAEPKILSTSSSLEELDEKIVKSDRIKSDPYVAKSRLLLNKDLISKIKDIKSNLGAKPKVLFNNFLKRFKDNDFVENEQNQKKEREFDIYSELIREKLKELPKDKADKARKFAYSLISQKLASGYAGSLNKHELAKQLIYHAATWKPTKLGSISREKEIDTALSVAWKAIVGGTWKTPLELGKAEILQYEFRHYRMKYQKSGVISSELKTLEIDTEKLLGKWYDLDGKIKSSTILGFDQNKKSDEELYKPDDYLLLQDNNQNHKYISRISRTSNLNINNTEDLQDFEHNDTFSKPAGYDYSFETEVPESEAIGNNVLYSIDLSKLSDSQKHLALRGSDTEIMEITTADNKQYFGKLKAMEVDENGELIMTFIPNSRKEFIKNKEIFTLNTGNTTSNLNVKQDQLTCNQYNTTESCRNDIEFTQIKKQGFKSLGEAVSGIFDKLLHIKSEGS
jgi:hypothetical protein